MRLMVQLSILTIVFILVMVLVTEASSTVRPNKNNDVWIAIKQVFPQKYRAGARCVVRTEVGAKWLSRYRAFYGKAIGRLGEVGPWQFNRGWWMTGWNGNSPLFKQPWRVRFDALYSTRKAWWLLKRNGYRWRVSWYLSARACRLD